MFRTAFTELLGLFDVGWPGAPHRVLRTPMVAAGDIELPPLRYGPVPPVSGLEGDVEALAFYAGQGCGLVHAIEPAGALVRRLAAEAAALVRGRLAGMVG